MKLGVAHSVPFWWRRDVGNVLPLLEATELRRDDLDVIHDHALP
jgi:hypothetical protein